RAGFVLTGADDDKPVPQSVASFDGEIDPLVRRECRDGEIVILARDGRGSVEIRIHWRINDSTLTAITFGNTLANRLTDSDEICHTICGATVPLSQDAEQTIHDSRLKAALPAEICFAHVPGIAHGSKAVADVRHVLRRADALRRAVTEAHHDIARRQPQALHRKGYN